MKHYSHEHIQKLGISVPTNVKECVEYKGIVDCAQKIYKNEGIAAFYKGLTPNLIKIFPQSGLFFLTYEAVLKYT